MPETLRRSARIRAAAALAVVAACGSLALAGCGSSDSSQAPPAATTAATTSPAPATTTPATTAPEGTTTATTTTSPAGAGDAAAGKVLFAQTCEACHAGLGTRAAVGPKLAGLGLKPAFIRMRVEKGKSPMPAGLVTGKDLEDIVAYVKSIQ
jgi:mono/diheme cytochrome c family protein